MTLITSKTAQSKLQITYSTCVLNQISSFVYLGFPNKRRRNKSVLIDPPPTFCSNFEIHTQAVKYLTWNSNSATEKKIKDSSVNLKDCISDSQTQVQ